MKISKLKISLPTSGHCYRIGSRVSSKLLMATRVHPFFCHKNKMSNIYTVIFGPISGVVCKVAALSPNRSPPFKNAKFCCWLPLLSYLVCSPQGVSASEMTYIVSGGALNSTHSRPHPHQ